MQKSVWRMLKKKKTVSLKNIQDEIDKIEITKVENIYKESVKEFEEIEKN